MWKKITVPLNILPETIMKLKLAITNGDSTLEQLRCVYKTKDEHIIQYLSPWDFIDNVKDIENIQEFYLYRWELK